MNIVRPKQGLAFACILGRCLCVQIIHVVFGSNCELSKQKGDDGTRRRIEEKRRIRTALKPSPLLSQTNPAHGKWEAGRIMKKVGRAKWWALVSDLNSNAVKNRNKKATSLRYQPLYHAFLPCTLPSFCTILLLFLSFPPVSSPSLFRQFCICNLW